MMYVVSKEEVKKFVTNVRKEHDVKIAEKYANKDVVTTEKKGLTPQLPNDAGKFLDGKGNWNTQYKGKLNLNFNSIDKESLSNQVTPSGISSSVLNSLTGNLSNYAIEGYNFLISNSEPTLDIYAGDYIIYQDNKWNYLKISGIRPKSMSLQGKITSSNDLARICSINDESLSSTAAQKANSSPGNMWIMETNIDSLEKGDILLRTGPETSDWKIIKENQGVNFVPGTGLSFTNETLEVDLSNASIPANNSTLKGSTQFNNEVFIDQSSIIIGTDSIMRTELELMSSITMENKSVVFYNVNTHTYDKIYLETIIEAHTPLVEDEEVDETKRFFRETVEETRWFGYTDQNSTYIEYYDISDDNVEIISENFGKIPVTIVYQSLEGETEIEMNVRKGHDSVNDRDVYQRKVNDSRWFKPVLVDDDYATKVLVFINDIQEESLTDIESYDFEGEKIAYFDEDLNKYINKELSLTEKYYDPVNDRDVYHDEVEDKWFYIYNIWNDNATLMEYYEGDNNSLHTYLSAASITAFYEHDGNLMVETKNKLYTMGEGSGNLSASGFRLGTTPIYKEGAMWIED